MGPGAEQSFYRTKGKRIFDLIVCLLVLPIAGPLILLLGALVRLVDGQPIFYRGLRTGLNDSRFYILKFRTMVPQAEKLGGPTTGLHDPRITRLGGILRKFKLDELPQFINVLRGEMSLVGPRPEVPQYTNRFSGSETIIVQIRPGITDFSSIKFHALDRAVGSSNVDEIFEKKILPRKNRLRVFYASRVSFCTDLFILCKTFRTLISRRVDT